MKAFSQKCFYGAQLGLELICHSWNTKRNKGPECPGAGRFPAQSPHGAALHGQERQRFVNLSRAVNFTLLTVPFILCRDTANSLGENSKAPGHQRGLCELMNCVQGVWNKGQAARAGWDSLLGIPFSLHPQTGQGRRGSAGCMLPATQRCGHGGRGAAPAVPAHTALESRPKPPASLFARFLNYGKAWTV